MNPEVQALLDPWPDQGLPHLGGLPPWDRVTPAALEAAYRAAVEQHRAELRAIADDPAPPDFANTVEALEDCGRALARLQTLLSVCAQTLATGDMVAVVQRLAPLRATADDAVAHDPRLFARVQQVHGQRHALPDEACRLVELLHERLLRRGAGLPPAARQRLAAIHARCAELGARFMRNLQADEQRCVWVDDEAQLAGLPEPLRRQLHQAAADAGQPQRWAVRNQRAVVWPLLTQATDRALRERVWRLWTGRGDQAGEHDNKPLVAEMLALRGEKARLLGHRSYAHLALSDRMARTPEAALALLERTWAPVMAATQGQLQAYQALADADPLRGPGIPLAPWDRLHYAEQLRRSRFGFDTEALRPYLGLDRLREALFWAAGRLHGLSFHALPDTVPRPAPDVAMFELRRDGQPHGVLVFDLFARPGKGHGSYQQQWRSAERFRGRVLPVSCITSNLPAPAAGEPVLLAWEYANVLFHEFGHALHMLCNASAYPSLGPLNVPWDFVELPSLLNERWLADRELLQRFARHHATGQPVPAALLDALEASLAYDRIFSVNLDYLSCAIVEMKLHLLADGQAPPPDVVRFENDTLARLGMPPAWDQIMRMPHNVHAMSDAYAAGLYVYLWADVLAADAAEAFAQAPGGWYDAELARRWHDTVLSAGARRPADEAYRAFRGRDPDPGALMRRFGLDAGQSAMPAPVRPAATSGVSGIGD